MTIGPLCYRGMVPASVTGPQLSFLCGGRRKDPQRKILNLLCNSCWILKCWWLTDNSTSIQLSLSIRSVDLTRWFNIKDLHPGLTSWLAVYFWYHITLGTCSRSRGGTATDLETSLRALQVAVWAKEVSPSKDKNFPSCLRPTWSGDTNYNYYD